MKALREVVFSLFMLCVFAAITPLAIAMVLVRLARELSEDLWRWLDLDHS